MPTLAYLEELARGAGEILSAGFGQAHQVEHKGVVDPVTEIDRRSEAYLLEKIHKQFPEHRIVAEESGGLDGSDDSLWYVDPLDGTVNYAHGLPIFSVSIAFAEKGRTTLGVVYNPAQNELYSAEEGRGARLNGETITVSKTDNLDGSLVVTGFPYDRRTNPENNLDHFNRFALRAQGVRRLGSAALDLCYVAAGRVDGFWEVRLNPWDVAAGALIVEEAGGRVTGMDGSPFDAAAAHLVASNGRVHDEMLTVIREFRARKGTD